MTLAAFQQAMADLSGSPAHCLAARADPSAALARYELTERERARLAAVVRQPGMSVNCTIHRTTRLVPIHTLLPLTCAALGDALKRELDDYWATAERPTVRFDIEARRFADHLIARIESGEAQTRPPAEALIDLVRLELAITTLQLAPPRRDDDEDGEDARMIVLSHHPQELLAAARATPIALAALTPRRSVAIALRCAGAVELFVEPPKEDGPDQPPTLPKPIRRRA